MGSLQTEIQKTLNSWGAVQQPAGVSIAYRIFDFVNNNPSCSSGDVVNGTGVDLGRASATLLTLYQKGKLDRKLYPNPNPEGKRDNIYRYWTAIDSFSDKGEKRMAKKPKKAKPTSEGVVRSSAPEPMGLPLFAVPRMKQFADENPYESANVILNNMSIQVASDVYKSLKEMFK
jgi:hypothetical protein